MNSIKLHGDKIFFGNDSTKALRNLEGKRAFVVTGGTTIKKKGYLDEVIAQLKAAGFSVKCFDSVEPDPSVETVQAGAEQMIEFSPDYIVAIGGGSPIDAAKAMWIFYEHPDLDFANTLDLVDIPSLRNKAKFVAIPTTSGTASEVTKAMVIKDKKKKLKKGIRTEDAIPDLAILEPKFTATMPAWLTAATGMDAFTHALEAYVSVKANDFSDVLATGALEGIFKFLPLAFVKPDNLEYREKVLNYQSIAGMAFSNVGLGIVHSMAHQLGGVFGVAHGLANALILPYVVQYNTKSEAAQQKYEHLAKRLGVSDLALAIKGLNKELEIPMAIKELDISKEEFELELDLIVKRALEDGCTLTNPRRINEKEMKALFKYIYEGKKIDF
ncbi:iron-containing alcohol dehydrogenase [Natroniella acetigena]|uniref:iron-containing alcohol dehydrogenase n=1 Tax=Natroniella acetigena TaxID=52004 RepID=UPI00200A03D6|nr:iron-containing alcohol dehydrogenase [Natroniella acetigena]MCK8827654.1 iron-containing alcohol dehydrogenase [Natroniella acetigena]